MMAVYTENAKTRGGNMLLSVVVPVHNEEGNISPLVGEIFAALEGAHEFEVIYVDDGSTDGTLEALRGERAARGERLRILRHEKACGQSTALFSGIRATRYPWIATLDGDGQNDPADIPKLIARIEPGGGEAPDLIIGHRQKRNDSQIRLLSSRIANGVRRFFLKDNTPDTGCGLKLIRRDVFIDLPYFDHMHRFLPALVLRAGGKVISEPVGHRARERGKSKYGIHNRLWVGIVDIFGVAWLRRRERRPARVLEE